MNCWGGYDFYIGVRAAGLLRAGISLASAASSGLELGPVPFQQAWR